MRTLRTKLGIRAFEVLEHIRGDKCERCLAVYRQVAKEAEMICFLRNSRN